MAKRADLQKELEALRRELRQVPLMAEEGDAAAHPASSVAAPADSTVRSEVERVLHDLQARLAEATDETEDAIAAHPFASVAAAFLLGILVANLMSRGK
jgi:ElaB/YqjD/DUF883 family membrane-anchored ribosome-binding protein